MGRLLAIALLAAAVAGCGGRSAGASSGSPGVPAPPVALGDLDERFEPLKQRFNADIDHRRLLVVVAPTCRACRDGIAQLRDRLLARLSDGDLRIYIIWMPLLTTDNRDEAARASAGMPADRMTLFWDRRRWLAEALGTTLRLPPDALASNPNHGLAWDVYLLYDRGLEWSDGPPAPAFWMQRLEGARDLAPAFDADALAERVLTPDW